jgi:glutamate/tyrosine decarboxylase-like PLP-dependent enzyme
MTPEAFRAAGHALVDQIAEFLTSIPSRPVSPNESPAEVRAALGGGALPVNGADPRQLLDEAAKLLTGHSLLNGHPRFYGYITSSAAPLGALGDLLAAAVNPNCGSFALSPMATEIERQTVRWISELIGYPTDGDGILVSGGNMANFVCFLAGRRARAPWNVRDEGLASPSAKRLRVYASSETHTWVQKACDLFGLGTSAMRWIPTDRELRMDADALARALAEDRANGDVPLIVVGTAGSVSTGAIDPLPRIAELCREHGAWFHVDGAYGALAALLPEASADLKGLSLADSVAVDPHKWLYTPLEAGCALVRARDALTDAYSWHPPYYHFNDMDGEQPVNFYERGPQNSRGFRALKVWLGLRQVGRDGYRRLLADDIALSRVMYERVAAHPRLEAFTQGLSITTFRYVPDGLKPGTPAVDEYLNALNTELLTRIQASGRAYPSNAVVRGAFLIRACIVNFRTTQADVEALPGLVVDLGDALDREMRPAALGRA